jgi:hypothetical protein
MTSEFRAAQRFIEKYQNRGLYSSMVLIANSPNKAPKKSVKKAALAMGKNPQLRDQKKPFRGNLATRS